MSAQEYKLLVYNVWTIRTRERTEERIRGDVMKVIDTLLSVLLGGGFEMRNFKGAVDRWKRETGVGTLSAEECKSIGDCFSLLNEYSTWGR